MSDTTPRISAPLLSAAQAQKHVTHNEALLVFDALIMARILDRDLADPARIAGRWRLLSRRRLADRRMDGAGGQHRLCHRWRLALHRALCRPHRLRRRRSRHAGLYCNRLDRLGQPARSQQCAAAGRQRDGRRDQQTGRQFGCRALQQCRRRRTSQAEQTCRRRHRILPVPDGLFRPRRIRLDRR